VVQVRVPGENKEQNGRRDLDLSISFDGGPLNDWDYSIFDVSTQSTLEKLLAQNHRNVPHPATILLMGRCLILTSNERRSQS